MNKEKKAAAGLLALSIPMMMLAFSAPAAQAVDVESTVAAIDSCAWQFAGTPTSLALEPADAGAKYEGTALTVSDSFTGLVLGLSGAASTATATDGTSTECSFYNDLKTAAIQVELATSATFTATYGASNTADTDMNFTIGVSNPLDVIADVTACGTGWADTDINFTALTSATDLFELDSASVENKYVAGAGERCSPSVEVEVTIPASSGIPAGAGQDYNFSGPSILITKAETDI